MSLNRKQRRASQQKLRKDTTAETATIETALDRMPNKCDECDTIFDRTNSSALDKWRIAVYDDGPIHLVCPACVPADVTKQNKEKK